MKIQRFFAIKGTGVLYLNKEKADALPENIREVFKSSPCGEGMLESFPSRIHHPITKHGYFVDEAK
jgi:hypothetical protein